MKIIEVICPKCGSITPMLKSLHDKFSKDDTAIFTCGFCGHQRKLKNELE